MLAPLLVVPPAERPVPLSLVKQHLRVDHYDDDVIIDAYIRAATAYLDGWSGILGRALVTQTWRQGFGGFPAGCGVLRLPLAPVRSVVSVSYLDAGGAEQTLPASAFALHADALGSYVGLAPGQYWPAARCEDGAVTVTYVAGYGDPRDVPVSIVHAILLLVGQWYLLREPVAVGVAPAALPNAVDALLAPYRRICL